MSKQICNACKLELDVSCFRETVSKAFKDKGKLMRVKTCRSCLAAKHKAYMAEYKKRNPKYWEKTSTVFKEEDKELVSAIKYRLRTCLQNARVRGKAIPMTVTAEELYMLWYKQNGKCALSGVDMRLALQHPASLSIDKIIPELGYTLSNVQWLCWAVNRAKGDMSQTMFINMCRKIIAKCND